MKKKILGLGLALLGVSLAAQHRNSFAILVDGESYRRCRPEIENYRASVTKDGLEAFVVAADWASPEQVKDSLMKYHAERKMEGTVLVGDIPIPMVQKAQHMTSAFKMDEERFPRRESSVPTDRFYDDFDLKFRFTGRDSLQSDLFYYELSPFSPQQIRCDIYSARIKPSSAYSDPYEELSAYLRKLVRVRAQKNRLDEVTSHTGDGSFSNSLVAWKDETVTLAEQLPDAFNGRKEGKFLLFAMQPDMKEILLEEIQRPELDLILFHEHGLTERQYVTGLPHASMYDEYFEMGKFHARSMVKTEMRYGRTKEEAERKLVEKYGLHPSWYEMTPETEKADSLMENSMVFELEDIRRAAPNVKMAIFDACYNGDFREDDWVANRYIMSEGDCIVATGNSVNVLQDKSSSDLLGMLAAGYRVGEWMQQVNILESHIFGDPTYHFESSWPDLHPDLENEDIDYWLSFSNGEDYPCFVRSLALHKLSGLDYIAMPDHLLKTYRTSPYYMERLQCLHLSARYEDDHYFTLLKEAADDPYEFIRRKACTYLGKVGSGEAAASLAKAYLNDFNSRRIAFDITFSAGHFPDSLFVKELRRAVEQADWISDKDGFIQEAAEQYRGPVSMAFSTQKILDDPESSLGRKKIYLSGMRNNPYPHLAEDLLHIVRDEAADTGLRVEAAETLGWFVRAWNRSSILETLKELLANARTMPVQVSEEISKTVARLEDYSR